MLGGQAVYKGGGLGEQGGVFGLAAPVLPVLRQGGVVLQGVQAAGELPQLLGAFFAEFETGQAGEPALGLDLGFQVAGGGGGLGDDAGGKQVVDQSGLLEIGEMAGDGLGDDGADVG